MNKVHATPLAGRSPLSERTSYGRLLPSTRGLLSTTTALVGGALSLKTDSTALGGSLLKLLLPSVHFCRNRSLRTLPTIRFGRSEKNTVTGDTSCKARTPSLKATFFAVCTNRNSGGFAGALVCAAANFVATKPTAAKHTDAATKSAEFFCMVASYIRYHTFAPVRLASLWHRSPGVGPQHKGQ